MIRFSLIEAALICIFMLAGCSPEYNWREVRAANDGYQAMFPAKPITVERDINLDGLRVSMKLTATEAGGHSFAVGIISLPADEQPVRERAVVAMQAQMARNVQASLSDIKPIRIPVYDASGKALGFAEGSRVVAKGSGTPNQLNGGFTARGSRAYQFMVIGTDPDPEVVQIFLDSFRFIQ